MRRNRFLRFPFQGVILLALAMPLLPASPANAQSSSAGDVVLSKPLEQFTMSDLFYLRGDAAIQDMLTATGQWRAEAQNLLRVAEGRKLAAERAIEIKRLEIDGLKVRKKHADEMKDKTAAKQLEVQIKSEDQAKRILERIVKLSESDKRVAESWVEWADAMMQTMAAGREIGSLRDRTFTSPIGSGPPTLHVDPRAYSAYSKHNKAMKDLGDRSSQVGSDLKKQSQEREHLLKDLVKGGFGTSR